MSQDRVKIIKKMMEEHKTEFEKMSDQIWDLAETRFQEYKSSEIQADYLEKQGFIITRKLGGMDTAFQAKAGHGKPVIAILGEFDALHRLSQVADLAQEKAIKEGEAGHGCGHNLLGTGGMEAACTIKKYLEENHLQGTIQYYGCPGEEGGAGKAFMVREGCFQEIDYAFTWHPMRETGIMNTALANVRMIFSFKGKSAHAATSPWDGRSALDACELMNVGVNYLREHVIPEARMHYAYLNAGGTAANIVPGQAQLLYSLRAPKAAYVKQLIERVSSVAKGAAMMTETSVDIRIVSAYSDYLAIPVMDQLMMETMQELEPLTYTEAEYNYAKQFNNPTENQFTANQSSGNQVTVNENKGIQASANQPSVKYATGIQSESDLEKLQSNIQTGIVTDRSVKIGSTDAADVSWQVPTGCICVTTMARDSVMHGWTVVAQGKSTIAYKGMHFAAETIANAAVRVFTSEELQNRLSESFRLTKGQETYQSLIPEQEKAGSF